MSQPNLHLFGESFNSWDTSYARRFLKIPEEQLKMINSIPEWLTKSKISTTEEVTSKFYTDQEVQIKNMGSAPSFRSINYMEKEKLNQLKSSEESVKNSEDTTEIVSQSNKKNHKLTAKKHSLSRSASLCILTPTDDPKDKFKLRSTSSAPNICHLQISHENLESVNSGKLSVRDCENLCKTPKVLKSKIIQDASLKCTDIIGTEMERESLQIQNHCDKIASKTIKSHLKLGNQVLNHKFFKNSSNIAATNSSDEKSSTNTVSFGKYHNATLDKRLMLLEKRFSPSKEFCILPSDEYVHDSKFQKLSRAISSKNKDYSTVKDNMLFLPQDNGNNNLDHSLEIETAHKVSSALQASAQVPSINRDQGIRPGDSSIHCVSQSSKKTFEKDLTFEETFSSQTIPCGQPLPPVENPLLQTSLLKKTSVKTTTTSSNIQINIPEQILNNVIISENHNEKTKEQHLIAANTQKVGTKRKRKSKEDTFKKLQHSKNFRKISIHFTSDQVRNMLDIMKMFNSEY